MKHFYIIICLIAALGLGSCTSKKQTLPYFEYMQSEKGVMGTSKYEVRIVPDDELLITVNSVDPRASAIYNMPLINPAINGVQVNSVSGVTKTATKNDQYQTYIVDKEGNIIMPVIGKIHVAGMTPEELSLDIKNRISKEVIDPIVNVSIKNFKVNVLGEVKNPQTIVVGTERFSIFDALAGAGDMTEYGNRDNVLIIRETMDGTKEYVRLDMHDPAIVNSPYFYLRQNDVVYVEPNAIRGSISKYDQNNSYKVQVVSTVVSAISVIASLVITLALR